MTTFDRVSHIVQEHTGALHIGLQDDLGALGADSLDIISMMISLEQEFDIEISDDAEINTVQDAVNYIEHRTC